jgi:hypothetical protein
MGKILIGDEAKVCRESIDRRTVEFDPVHRIKPEQSRRLVEKAEC